MLMIDCCYCDGASFEYVCEFQNERENTIETLTEAIFISIVDHIHHEQNTNGIGCKIVETSIKIRLHNICWSHRGISTN